MGVCASNPAVESSIMKTQRACDPLASTRNSSSTTILDEVVSETSHPILRAIETMQTEWGRPYGRILDAGTGLGSFRWLAHLMSNKDEFDVNPENWVAVTASEVMYNVVTKEAKRIGLDDPENHLILGNWFENENEDHLLHGEKFDTILVDYLIGTYHVVRYRLCFNSNSLQNIKISACSNSLSIFLNMLKC
jgi:2-polyprenyl-3-methyl-5-hydroxy-6-metoxy-1,4-benzoquinol methylase